MHPYKVAAAISLMALTALATNAVVRAPEPALSKDGSAVETVATATSSAQTNPSLTGFGCTVASLPKGMIATVPNSITRDLSALGNLTVLASDNITKNSLSNGLGKLAFSDKDTGSYYSISSQETNAASTDSVVTGINAEGGVNCFASVSNKGTESVQTLNLSLIKQTILSPKPGANLSKTKLAPFKARLEGVDSDRYAMYWQVNNDKLNLMKNEAGTNMKVAPGNIDFSGWNWKEGSSYSVKFIAKDKTGATISQESVAIWVVQ